MRTLGIDMAIRNTGYAVLDNRKTIHTERFVSTSSEFYSPAYLVEHLIKFKQMLRDYKPDLVVIEGPALAASGYQFAIGALYGILTEYTYEHKIATFSMPPATWKFIITGKGNATKQQIRTSINYNFHIDEQFGRISQDEYDAIGMAFVGYLAMHYYMNGVSAFLTSKQKHVFIGENGLLKSQKRSWFIRNLRKRLLKEERKQDTVN